MLDLWRDCSECFGSGGHDEDGAWILCDRCCGDGHILVRLEEE